MVSILGRMAAFWALALFALSSPAAILAVGVPPNGSGDIVFTASNTADWIGPASGATTPVQAFYSRRISVPNIDPTCLAIGACLERWSWFDSPGGTLTHELIIAWTQDSGNQFFLFAQMKTLGSGSFSGPLTSQPFNFNHDPLILGPGGDFVLDTHSHWTPDLRLIVVLIPSADVPEPMSLALVGLGLVGMGFGRRGLGRKGRTGPA